METNSILSHHPELLPPPRLRPNLELGAFLHQGYSDSRRPSHVLEAVEEFALFEPIQVENPVTPEFLEQAKKMAFQHPDIKNLAANGQLETLGLRVLDQKGRDSYAYVLVLFDYTRNYALEVHIEEGLNRITEVKQVDYQPAATASETQASIELAQHDERVAAHLHENMVGQAILITQFDYARQKATGRLFDVQFGYSQERLPRYKAIVDLGQKKVIYHRPIQQAEPKRKGACDE